MESLGNIWSIIQTFMNHELLKLFKVIQANTFEYPFHIIQIHIRTSVISIQQHSTLFIVSTFFNLK